MMEDGGFGEKMQHTGKNQPSLPCKPQRGRHHPSPLRSVTNTPNSFPADPRRSRHSNTSQVPRELSYTPARHQWHSFPYQPALPQCQHIFIRRIGVKRLSPHPHSQPVPPHPLRGAISLLDFWLRVRDKGPRIPN